MIDTPALPTISRPDPEVGLADLATVRAGGARGLAEVTVDLAAGDVRVGGDARISLQYRSGGSNGPFGIGWALDVPRIERRNDRCVPRYRDDGPERDELIHTTIGELVPCAAQQADGSWRVERAPAAGEHVVRHRPRRAGSRARIERRMRSSDGSEYWTITDEAGVRHTFGVDSGGQVADPAGGSRVASWLLQESRDDRGNVILYQYKREDRGDGEDVGRPAPAQEPGQYLKRVLWGNARPGEADRFRFELVFDYGDHGEHAPTPVEASRWTSRLDPHSDCRRGFEVRCRRLCRRILLFIDASSEGQARPQLVRAHRLSYRERADGTQLSAISVIGTSGSGGQDELPPTEFLYTATDAAPNVRALAGAACAERLVDLDGNGLPGALSGDGGALRYRSNVGGRLAPARTLASEPALALAGAPVGAPFADGRCCVFDDASGTISFHARAGVDDWAPMAALPASPTAGLTLPGVRQLDLDGDGRRDLVATTDTGVAWHAFRGLDGWSAHEQAALAPDAFSALCDPTGAVFSADMSGDGLEDLVRIGPGSVVYWANLGHGRFGPAVRMAGSPMLGDPQRFDPARIRLADVDGTGCADLIEMTDDQVRIHRNLSGNGFDAPRSLTGLPPVTSLEELLVVDLLGTGGSCLVWQSRAPAASERAVRYCELATGQPNLLRLVRDNHGSETEIVWTSSVQAMLDAADAGRPWAVCAPAVVPLVHEVNTTDRVTGTVEQVTWRYRDMVYDRASRELRGFAAVEDRSQTTYARDDGHAADPARVTRTFYDSGTLEGRQRLAEALASQAAAGDALSSLDARVDDPGGLASLGDALASLEGAVLREEVFGDDGSAASLIPYRTILHGWDVRVVQPSLDGAPSCVEPVEREKLVMVHERTTAVPPRISHELTLAIDSAGTQTRTATITYGRSDAGADPTQRNTTITVADIEVAYVDRTDAYRHAVPIAVTRHELTGAAAPPTQLYSATEVNQAIAQAGSNPAVGPRLTLLDAVEARYWNDPRTAPLARGDPGSRALIHHVRQATLTTDMLAAAYAPDTPSPLDLQTLGLESDGGTWWAPGEVVEYEPDGFLLPISAAYPGAAARSVRYDAQSLEVIEEHDAAGGVASATIDPLSRVATEVVEADGLILRATVDALGRLTSLARSTRGGQGDPPSAPFRTWTHERSRWFTHGEPDRVTGTFRPGGGSRPDEQTVTHFDGFGRPALVKILAEPGPAPSRGKDGELKLDPSGAPLLEQRKQRWIANERVVARTTGPPRRTYLPYPAADDSFEPERDAAVLSSAEVVLADALSRDVLTERAAGTHTRTVRPDAWTVQAWDANDCAPKSPWYARRIAPGADAAAAEEAAGAAANANTHTTILLDAAGRETVVLELPAASAPPLRTEVQHDALGRQTSLRDPRGVQAQLTLFDLRGQPIRGESSDSGVTRALFDSAGRAALAWGARQQQERIEYDVAGRVTKRWMRLTSTQPWRLLELTAYGDAAPAPAPGSEPMLHGKPWLVFDGAGLTAYRAYGLDGTPRLVERHLLADPTLPSDWTSLSTATPGQLEAQAAGLLSPEALTLTLEHDAAGRLISQAYPDGTAERRRYGPRGTLEQLDVSPSGAKSVSVLSAAEYDSAGRLTRRTLGNGVTEERIYAEHGGALQQARTRRSDGTVLREDHCRYDAEGNLLRVSDAASQTQFFANAVVPNDRVYGYDGLSRLIRAEGREVAVPIGAGILDDAAVNPLPHPNDPSAVRRYTETYRYDGGGNLARVDHSGIGGGTGTTTFTIDPLANRVTARSGPAPGSFAYDADGNALTLGLLNGLSWDEDNRLANVDLGGGGVARYAYDSDGWRVRKTIDRLGGSREDRVTLGSWERWRRVTGAGTADGQTITLIVGPPGDPLVLLELRSPPAQAVSWRYQHRDQAAGSVQLETDAQGKVITHEEFRPYGTSAYRCAVDTQAPPPRLRFGSRERDAETGLDYAGARYYASWLGRWASPDPAGMVDGPNRYRYVRDNPVRWQDPLGTQAMPRASEAVQPPSAADVASHIAPRGRPFEQWVRFEYEGQIHRYHLGRRVVNGRTEVFADHSVTPAPSHSVPQFPDERREITIQPMRPTIREHASVVYSRPQTTHHDPVATLPPLPPPSPAAPADPPPTLSLPTESVPAPAPPPPEASSPPAVASPAPSDTPARPAAPAPGTGDSPGRGWWSRGGQHVALGLGGAALAAGITIFLVSNPVGWFIGGMAIGAGLAGAGAGIWQLSTSDQRTAQEDEQLNRRIGTATLMGSSPLGLIGGAAGYAIDGEEGMFWGALGGAGVEAGYGVFRLGQAGVRWLTAAPRAVDALSGGVRAGTPALEALGETAPALGRSAPASANLPADAARAASDVPLMSRARPLASIPEAPVCGGPARASSTALEDLDAIADEVELADEPALPPMPIDPSAPVVGQILGVSPQLQGGCLFRATVLGARLRGYPGAVLTTDYIGGLPSVDRAGEEIAEAAERVSEARMALRGALAGKDGYRFIRTDVFDVVKYAATGRGAGTVVILRVQNVESGAYHALVGRATADGSLELFNSQYIDRIEQIGSVNVTEHSGDFMIRRYISNPNYGGGYQYPVTRVGTSLPPKWQLLGFYWFPW